MEGKGRETQACIPGCSVVWSGVAWRAAYGAAEGRGGARGAGRGVVGHVSHSQAPGGEINAAVAGTSRARETALRMRGPCPQEQADTRELEGKDAHELEGAAELEIKGAEALELEGIFALASL